MGRSEVWRRVHRELKEVVIHSVTFAKHSFALMLTVKTSAGLCPKKLTGHASCGNGTQRNDQLTGCRRSKPCRHL